MSPSDQCASVQSLPDMLKSKRYHNYEAIFGWGGGGGGGGALYKHESVSIILGMYTTM